MLRRIKIRTEDTAGSSNLRMPLPIALDYRPALLSRAGIGRATRELAGALARLDDVDVHLFGHSLARARVAAAATGRARLHRAPIPGRSLGLLRRVAVNLGVSPAGSKVEILANIQQYVPVTFGLSMFAVGDEYTDGQVRAITARLLARPPSRRQPEAG